MLLPVDLRPTPKYPTTCGKKGGREFADCNSVFPHRGWGGVGAKGPPHPTPLCKKLSVSWMRAVQNIRLFEDKEDFWGSARKGLREWGNSAVKCFAVYKKLLATEEGDFLVQKMLFRQHQPPSISCQMPCYQTNRRLAEMPKFLLNISDLRL